VPFPVDTLDKLYYCHLNMTPDHPSDVERRCPRDLGDVIMRLLKKKPKDRYETCDQIRIVLSDVGRSRI